MSKLLHVTYRDYCPELDQYHAIVIDVADVQFLGMDVRHVEKMGFSCSFKDTCQYRVEHMDCPLFLNAPVSA